MVLDHNWRMFVWQGMQTTVTENSICHYYTENAKSDTVVAIQYTG